MFDNRLDAIWFGIMVSEARQRELNYEEAYLKLRKGKLISFEEDLRLVDEEAEVRAELQSSISNAISY